MLTIDLGEASEVVVIDGSNLAQYLGDSVYGQHGRGWKLIAVLDEEKLEHYNETQPNSAFKQEQGEYGNNVRLHQLQKVQKIKTHRFLLGKTRDTVLEELGQKVSSVESRYYEAETAKKKAQEKLKELEVKLAGAEASVLELKREAEENDRILNEKQNTLRNMEVDISKIRTAVGDIRMKEILGR